MKYIKLLMALCVLFASFSLNLKGQNSGGVTVESTINDQAGNPVANASIYGDEGKSIKYTDQAGHFSITVPANSVLYITAKGYLDKKVWAVPQMEKIVLEKQSNQKSIVNVAYRTVDKKDLTGTVSVLNPAEYINVDNNRETAGGINGRVGGLLGTGSIWGMGGALVLIDNIPSSLSNIKLDEVDQITVLKGINAVALYGSQAAKGAILVTSKRGSANKREINLRINHSYALPKGYPHYLGSADYMSLYNEARVNDGLAPLYSDEMIQNYKSGNKYRFPSTDYFSSDYLKKYMNYTDANAEFSGGNDVATFYTNIGWSNSTSLMNFGESKNDGNNRYNIRANIDVKLSDYIKSSINVATVYSQTHTGGTGNFWSTTASLLPNKFSPLIPVDQIGTGSADALLQARKSENVIDGKYILGGTQDIQTNALAEIYAGNYVNNVDRSLQISNGVDFDLRNITKGLTFHTLVYEVFSNSYYISLNNTYKIYSPTWSDQDSITALTAYGTDTHTGTQSIGGTAQTRNLGAVLHLDYEKSINDVHNFNAMLLGSGSSIMISGNKQANTNTNLGLQLGYNYKHKYLVNFSGNFMNSTKLSAKNRVAFSPNVSMGWVINKENFLADSKIVNFLKLTAAAGYLNSDLDIPSYYLYDGIFSTQSGGFGWDDGTYSASSTVSTYGASPDLKFPKLKQYSVGLEGSLFQNLLNFQTTYFLVRDDGMPTQRFNMYPGYNNQFIPYTNYNCNEYSGIDFDLNANKKVGEVELNLGIHGTYATSKVIKRDELNLDAYQNAVGKPVDAIFGLQNKGFFQDQNDINNSPAQQFGDVAPGDIKYVDENNDGKVDTKDAVKIGRWGSPINLGLNFSAAYKNFTFFVSGTGSYGGDGVKTNNYYWVQGDNKYSDVVLNRWTPDTKTIATYPRLSSKTNNNDFRYSDFWLYKTDRFNIDKVQLSYELPKDILAKTFIRELGVYLYGSNLFTISKSRSILDLNIGSAPQFRYYNLGVRANF
ncbi:MAG: SusC/RagA family TonB-linked outer membrane protein [Bacteroidota bacterium]|nr:SusC/RagA family TonB-linked outer membrane protein [Bacteroidota bacterium]MDP4274955.1 SusC/RagA family TonB-linked outer membrane protein [Bacteroidota bacterium]